MSNTAFFQEIAGSASLSEQQIENLKERVRTMKKYNTVDKCAELENSTLLERKWLKDQGFDVYQKMQEKRQWCRNCEASDQYDIMPCYSHCPQIVYDNVWMLSWQ